MFNFQGDQQLVHTQVQAAGSVVVVEGSGDSLKAVINRSADDLSKEFADEIGEADAHGALAMMTMSYAAEGKVKPGGYLLYEGKRGTIQAIKPRRYGGVLIRLRLLVQESAA